MSFVHPKHAFMPCWIAVEYVARFLHFSASSFFSEMNYGSKLSFYIIYLVFPDFYQRGLFSTNDNQVL